MSVGMPADLYLEEFGFQVWAAFGATAYHVGSSVKGKQWRDVDVRLILPDAVYDQYDLGDPEHSHENAKWVSLVLAYSALGKSMTGLPIDFQIQQQSWANAHFSQKEGCLRSALGIRKRLQVQSLMKGKGTSDE